MQMETFSLFDDKKQSSLRDDLNMFEVYKTRLVRVDLGTRSRADPLQRWIHKYLRRLRYQRLSRKATNNNEGLGTFSGSGGQWSYQNTILIADILGRIITTTMMVIFLITPLVILSHQSSKDYQLITISIFVLILSFLISLCLKVNSFEIVAVSAAYAAILSVFVSNIG
jgi:hypothetical protein